MKSLRSKVAIIGAGNVGSTFAFSLMISGLAREIVLIDRNEKKAAGECMDLNHSLSFAQPTKIYSSGYEGCEGADLVVITAGAKQKSGQTRIDLVQTNTGIFKIGGMIFAKYCSSCGKRSHCDLKKNPEALFEEVKNAAYKIIELKGATYYAIALALVRITEAVLRDENSILPVSTLISDYYGVNDVCLSIPSLVNRNGVEQFLRLDLSNEEQERFEHSAKALKKVIDQIKF